MPAGVVADLQKSRSLNQPQKEEDGVGVADGEDEAVDEEEINGKISVKQLQMYVSPVSIASLWILIIMLV